MKHYIFSIALICFLTVAGASSSFASASARLHVTATVPPFVSFNAVQSVTSYQVNSGDIRRGYVDLPRSMTVRLRTNLSTGVPVLVENSGEGSILVRESGRADFVGNSFTLSTAGYSANAQINKSYDIRILLPSDAKDGTYPLVIAMAPAI